MSKFQEKLDKYHELMDKRGTKYDAELFRKVAKGLGPSIYLRDAESVSCGDSKELDRVKKNFLMKKHGMEDEAKADAAIKKVCDSMKGDRSKKRAIFYYHLVKELGLEGNY